MTPAGLTVLLAVERVDMRRSFRGLSLWVKERLGSDPMTANAMFVFVNKRGDRLKALWRDGTGWCLLAKRLDTRVVVMPPDIPDGATSVRIDAGTLGAMLDGVARQQRETARDIARAARAAASRASTNMETLVLV
jgi:transposase